MILAIDPGTIESGYVLVNNDLSKIQEKAKINNKILLNKIREKDFFQNEREEI